MSEIQASAHAIRELTRDINDRIKEINNLGSELGSHLKRLGTTFQDQGYQTIQGYVSKTQKKVEEAIPDMRTIMKKLIDYAAYIEKSTKVL